MFIVKSNGRDQRSFADIIAATSYSRITFLLINKLKPSQTYSSTRNRSSHTDVRTHVGNTHNYPIHDLDLWSFDVRSIDADRSHAIWYMCTKFSLALVAEVVFILERIYYTQTHSHRPMLLITLTLPTHRLLQRPNCVSILHLVDAPKMRTFQLLFYILLRKKCLCDYPDDSCFIIGNTTSSIKPEVHTIAKPSEEDWATATGNVHKKFGEFRTCDS